MLDREILDGQIYKITNFPSTFYAYKPEYC